MSSKLSEYIERNRLTSRIFSDLVSKRMIRGKVSARTVESWRTGKVLPRREAIEAIAKVTNNEITANDFVSL